MSLANFDFGCASRSFHANVIIYSTNLHPEEHLEFKRSFMDSKDFEIYGTPDFNSINREHWRGYFCEILQYEEYNRRKTLLWRCESFEVITAFLKVLYSEFPQLVFNVAFTSINRIKPDYNLSYDYCCTFYDPISLNKTIINYGFDVRA